MVWKKVCAEKGLGEKEKKVVWRVWKKVCAEKGLGGKEKVVWRWSGKRSMLRMAREGRRRRSCRTMP